MIGAVALLGLALASSSVPPPTTTSAPTTAPAGTTTTVPAEPTTTGVPIPSGFAPLVDDTGLLLVAVPDAWGDIDTVPAQNEDGTARPYIAASPDLQKFFTTFDEPGLLYLALPYAEDPTALLGQYGLTSGCASMDVREYDDPVFVGVVQVGTGCGPNNMQWNMIVASPADHSFTAVLQVQTADQNELDIVRLTFNYQEGS
jgi:hypothetical protein